MHACMHVQTYMHTYCTFANHALAVLECYYSRNFLGRWRPRRSIICGQPRFAHIKFQILRGAMSS